MSKFSETIKKESRQISLASDEKRLLRERVVSYMEYHPLPEGVRTLADRTADVPVHNPGSSLKLEPFSVFRLNTSYLYKFSFFSLLLVVVAVPVFAEQALPGDMLYPMKVQVNEELRSTLALTPYAKIEWESARLERRLAEARILAQEGKLTDVLEEEVARAVKKHSDSAQETILSLRQTNTEEATLAEVAFVSRLQAQSDIFNLARTSKEEGEEVTTMTASEVSPSTLATALKTAYAQAETSQSQMPVSVQQLLALFERETTYAEELFRSIAKSINSKDKQDIERRLQDIQRKVEKSQMLMAGDSDVIVQTETVSEISVEEAIDETIDTESATNTENERVNTTTLESVDSTTQNVEANDSDDIAMRQEVTLLLRGAIVDTRKLISFMTLLDVRQVTSVDRLVPITLTKEEYESLLQKHLIEITALETSIVNRAVNSDIQEKVTYSLDRVAEYKTTISKLQAEQRLTEAATLAKNAKVLLEDTAVLIATQSMRVPVLNNQVESMNASATATTSLPINGDEGDVEVASSTEEAL